MNLQIIKSTKGQPEYVLLPVAIYQQVRPHIDQALKQTDEYVPFTLEDYLDNPIAIARIKANLTQKQLAELAGVTQAYISKLERQTRVSAKVLDNILRVISDT